MLLTIATTWRPATDLGYLLVKNPARCQSFPLPFGQAHVFYPEAGEDRCQAALLLDLDPVGLVRRPRGANSGDGGALRQYVNDRPYVASSFLSVALARVFGSALKGNSKDRPELADTPIPLEAKVAVLPCRGGEPFLRRLFEPLGYAVEARRQPLDERFPEWGRAPTTRYGWRRPAGSATCSPTSTCCFPCSTTTSTTGSARRSWTSCWPGEKAGCPRTRSGNRSPAATSSTSATWRGRRSSGSPPRRIRRRAPGRTTSRRRRVSSARSASTSSASPR